jgi:hypothetical protein
MTQSFRFSLMCIFVRCEGVLGMKDAPLDVSTRGSATDLHVAATNQVNLALYTLHLWMWDASSMHLQRAKDLAESMRMAPGGAGGGLPPVFSGYHCVVFSNMTWGLRLNCLQRVAQHVKHHASRPLVARMPPLPLARLHVAYMSSDFAAHTTGANILGMFRK